MQGLTSAVDTGGALLGAPHAHQPDVAVASVRHACSTGEGLRAAAGARSRRPGLPVLTLAAGRDGAAIPRASLVAGVQRKGIDSLEDLLVHDEREAEYEEHGKRHDGQVHLSLIHI